MKPTLEEIEEAQRILNDKQSIKKGDTISYIDGDGIVVNY